ncbi:protein of unknown function [Xenorhabdus doucetiae]|uniref:Uncharacterized protein n=1 Tax=Xenorhabdus doucetiae TaxID=351671 RepID=A0A068QW04_9GAMM|nr:hypothetical protein LY16_03010 [Xenorhabdus doucetiae]CDG18811.1 protein of unknown function [Xenorhabdus doucetiae]
MEDVIKRNKGNVDYCKGKLNYIKIHHNEYQGYSKDFFENLRQNKKYSSVAWIRIVSAISKKGGQLL